MRQVMAGERVLYLFGYVHTGIDPFNQRRLHVYFCYSFLRYDRGGSEWLPCHNNNQLEYDKTWERYGGPLPERDTLPRSMIKDYPPNLWGRE